MMQTTSLHRPLVQLYILSPPFGPGLVLVLVLVQLVQLVLLVLVLVLVLVLNTSRTDFVSERILGH